MQRRLLIARSQIGRASTHNPEGIALSLDGATIASDVFTGGLRGNRTISACAAHFEGLLNLVNVKPAAVEPSYLHFLLESSVIQHLRLPADSLNLVTLNNLQPRIDGYAEWMVAAPQPGTAA